MDKLALRQGDVAEFLEKENANIADELHVFEWTNGFRLRIVVQNSAEKGFERLILLPVCGRVQMAVQPHKQKIRRNFGQIGEIHLQRQKKMRLVGFAKRVNNISLKHEYQTQEELLEVAREYRRRGIPLDVIVCDYFHWPLQGEWRFDPTYWPDPDGMIRELKEMGVELMVSVWPTVDKRCSHYPEMVENGYLMRTDRGYRIGTSFHGEVVFTDFTNPEARAYVWDRVKKNYFDKGIRLFWLDVAEPEYDRYDFDNYRYWGGPVLQVGNVYPGEYARAFYEGEQASGEKNVVNLIRSAWAGSQKYGALVWSGDIASSFESMRNQMKAGLNMGIAGMPWWTTDIGGFYGGCGTDPNFRELLARWFAWGAFLPVMRMHGDRRPVVPQQGTTGGACCLSGAPNEIWSFGEEIQAICEKYIRLRESMRDYVREQMRKAHERGTPVMRPLFYDFPKDERCWNVDDAYMFGPDYLVAPITELGQRSRSVYLPEGANWKEMETGKKWEGGQTVTVDAPIDVIPVLIRMQ